MSIALTHAPKPRDRALASPDYGPRATIAIALVVVADMMVITGGGFLLTGRTASAVEASTLVLSGPLAALLLAVSGGYRQRLLDWPALAALAAIVVTAVVIVLVVLLSETAGREAASTGAQWFALSALGLALLRPGLRHLGQPSANGTSRPSVRLLVPSAPSSPPSDELRLVPARQQPWCERVVAGDRSALESLRADWNAEPPSKIVLSPAVLEAFAAFGLRERFVDLLLAQPGRVQLAIPGGTRDGTLFLDLSLPPLRPLDEVLKRVFDLTLTSALIVLLAPLLAVVALAIKLDSPGPVLFRQPRLGRYGRIFEVLKFRTMYADQCDRLCRRLTTRDDPRVTRVGAFLRRSSLDELPQLFNVLRGEMSLVGPRPHPPGAEAAGRPYEAVVADLARRLRVKPGVTGLAQVEGWRGNTVTERDLIERVRLDIDYIERWSLWLDLWILLRTPIATLSGRNAY